MVVLILTFHLTGSVSLDGQDVEEIDEFVYWLEPQSERRDDLAVTSRLEMKSQSAAQETSANKRRTFGERNEEVWQS